MPKFLIRIVSFLLVPCLIGDPMLASAVLEENSAVPFNSRASSIFPAQALELTPVGAQRYSMSFHSKSILVGTLIVGLLTQKGWAQAGGISSDFQLPTKLDDQLSTTDLSVYEAHRYANGSIFEKIKIIQSVANYSSQRSVDFLVRITETETDDSLTQEAISSLGKIKTPYALRELIRLFVSASTGRTADIIGSRLAERDEPEAFRSLVGALVGSNDFARRTATELLYEKAHSQDLVDFIISYLTSNSFVPDDRYLSQDIATRMLAVLQKTKTLDMPLPFRFRLSTLETLVTNREHNLKDGRPLAVILQGHYDPLGAFASADADIIIPLIQQGYRVLLYQAGNVDRLTTSLLEATEPEPASVLVFAGHGNRKGIALTSTVRLIPHGIMMEVRPDEKTVPGGVFHKFSPANKAEQRRIANALIPGGQIIVEACSTGKDGWWGRNIADYLRTVFPQAKPGNIWSPTNTFSSVKLDFDKRKRIRNVTYSDYDDSDKKVIIPTHRAFAAGQAPNKPGAWGAWKWTWVFSDYLNPLKNAFALKRAARLEGIVTLLFMIGSVSYMLFHGNLLASAAPWAQVFSRMTLEIAVVGAIPVFLGHLPGVLQVDGTVKKDFSSYGVAILKASIALLGAPILVMAVTSPVLIAIPLLQFTYRLATGPHIVLNPMSNTEDQPTQSHTSIVARIGSYLAHVAAILWLLHFGGWSLALFFTSLVATSALLIRYLLPDTWKPAIDHRSVKDELYILAGWLVLMVLLMLPDTQLTMREFEKRFKDDHPIQHFIDKHYTIQLIPLGPNSKTKNPGQKGKFPTHAFSPTPRTTSKNLDFIPAQSSKPIGKAKKTFVAPIPLPIPVTQPTIEDPPLIVAPAPKIPYMPPTEILIPIAPQAAPLPGQGTQNTFDWTSPFKFATVDFSKRREEIDPFVMTPEEMKDWYFESSDQYFHIQGNIRGLRLHIQKADEGNIALDFIGDVASGKAIVQYYPIHVTKNDGQEEETIEIIFPPEDIHSFPYQFGNFQQGLHFVATIGQTPTRIKIRAIEFLQTEQKKDLPPAPELHVNAMSFKSLLRNFLPSMVIESLEQHFIHRYLDTRQKLVLTAA